MTAIAVINGERQPIGAIENKIACWVDCDGRVARNIAGPGVRYQQSSFVRVNCYRRTHAHVDVFSGFDLERLSAQRRSVNVDISLRNQRRIRHPGYSRRKC